ncbi:hypothetical protein B0H17DRAFT_1124496 [Mycena rosella]|uniref:Uncharacterized protein n=1 Tax=Mycena rosella TaxID=1033263 RepID=A0AAD7MAR4_MYCRO|nr:hypothetical protein B0H17DRAFT_1124496 [Mycena rosella]
MLKDGGAKLDILLRRGRTPTEPQAASQAASRAARLPSAGVVEELLPLELEAGMEAECVNDTTTTGAVEADVVDGMNDGIRTRPGKQGKRCRERPGWSGRLQYNMMETSLSMRNVLGIEAVYSCLVRAARREFWHRGAVFHYGIRARSITTSYRKKKRGRTRTTHGDMIAQRKERGRVRWCVNRTATPGFKCMVDGFGVKVSLLRGRILATPPQADGTGKNSRTGNIGNNVTANRTMRFVGAR